jgi:glycosyltransferase involved in cell wall biosynthesis
MINELISVIMPCYKEPDDYFKAAVDSILKQTYRNLELIIILDDPTNHNLLELGYSYTQKDSRVKFFVNERNQGLTATLNRGLKIAGGKIIARLDADDIALQDRFQEQIKYLDTYDLVSTNFAFINDKGKIIRHRIFPSNSVDVKRYLLEVADCMYHTTWMGKKYLFNELHGYREIGPFEDYDLLLRAVKHGFHLCNLKKELTYFRINTEGISCNNKICQHLGSEFIRMNADKIDLITSEDLKVYLNSNIGRKHLEEYKKFYHYTSKIYASSDIQEYYKKLLFYGPYLALFNYYGRLKIKQKIKMLF